MELKPIPHLVNPDKFLLDLDLTNEKDLDPVEDIVTSNLVLKWNKFDEDDKRTWPPRDITVLGLRCWTKLNHRYGNFGRRGEDRPAVFYEACYGWYDDTADDIKFFLDHGNGDETDDEDFVDPPRWWSFIATPQKLDLE